MTREERELLAKDLCARLPYGVKAKITEEGVLSYDSGIGVIVGKEHVDNEIFILQCKNDSWCLTAISEFVPYLRPMSSMTQEEMDNFQQCLNIIENENYGDGWSPAAWGQMAEFIHYCNEHHLDYNGLIAMGLALEAPEGMYNI